MLHSDFRSYYMVTTSQTIDWSTNHKPYGKIKWCFLSLSSSSHLTLVFSHRYLFDVSCTCMSCMRVYECVCVFGHPCWRTVTLAAQMKPIWKPLAETEALQQQERLPSLSSLSQGKASPSLPLLLLLLSLYLSICHSPSQRGAFM